MALKYGRPIEVNPHLTPVEVQLPLLSQGVLDICRPPVFCLAKPGHCLGLGRETGRLDLDSLMGDATLAAIARSNGRGKTTLLEKFHPVSRPLAG